MGVACGMAETQTDVIIGMCTENKGAGNDGTSSVIGGVIFVIVP
jgi:hypothetical protein